MCTVMAVDHVYGMYERVWRLTLFLSALCFNLINKMHPCMVWHLYGCTMNQRLFVCTKVNLCIFIYIHILTCICARVKKNKKYTVESQCIDVHGHVSMYIDMYTLTDYELVKFSSKLGRPTMYIYVYKNMHTYIYIYAYIHTYRSTNIYSRHSHTLRI